VLILCTAHESIVQYFTFYLLKMKSFTALLVATLLLFVTCRVSVAFSPPSLKMFVPRQHSTVLQAEGKGNDASTENDDSAKKSLKEKMASWEATEEEIKQSTLGGVVPGRSDAFDVGLYIAFPFMVIACLSFAFFPLIMDRIDVSSVGPPPT